MIRYIYIINDKAMLLKGSTLMHLLVLTTTTGDLTTEGQPEPRLTIKVEHSRGHATLLANLRKLIEIAVVKEGVDISEFKDGGTIPIEKVEWVKLADQKERKELTNRFTDNELTLTDKEVAFLKYAIKNRDEQPTADIETLDQLAALGLEE